MDIYSATISSDELNIARQVSGDPELSLANISLSEDPSTASRIRIPRGDISDTTIARDLMEST